MADGKIPQEFEVGEPVLVCRWRLSAGKLPAFSRHMRALGKRVINGKPLSKQLTGWVKQHIEWTLADGSHENPDGVLMLMVDAEGRAAMAVGPYEALADTTASALAERARTAEREGSQTEVAPETFWAVKDNTLMVNLGVGDALSGATSLIVNLAETLGMSLERQPTLLDDYDSDPSQYSEIFLVSDEHGVVLPAAGDNSGVACAAGKYGQRFADGWETLLKKSSRPGGRAYARPHI